MSIFRISLIAVVIGVLFLVGSFVAITIEQQSYRSALRIDPPEGTTLLTEAPTTETRSTVYYETALPLEDVVRHYETLMVGFYDTSPNDPMRERCRRNPAGGAVFSNYVEGNGTVPFEVKCLFERSGINATQETLVIIQPGVRNDAENMNNEGKTIIYHEQLWSP